MSIQEEEELLWWKTVAKTEQELAMTALLFIQNMLEHTNENTRLIAILPKMKELYKVLGPIIAKAESLADIQPEGAGMYKPKEE